MGILTRIKNLVRSLAQYLSHKDPSPKSDKGNAIVVPDWRSDWCATKQTVNLGGDTHSVYYRANSPRCPYVIIEHSPKHRSVIPVSVFKATR
jgi:hypothetical protein